MELWTWRSIFTLTIAIVSISQNTVKSSPSPTNESITTESSTHSVLNSTSEKPTDSQLSVCDDNYQPPSDADRACIPGLFECRYGVCEKSSMFSCICDPGATGLLCDTECCLDCGENGNCLYDMTNDRELCNCLPNYSGERCERLKEPTTSDSVRDTTTDISTSPSSNTGSTPEPCNSGCCLECGNHGTCTFDILTMTEVCYCDPSYTGEKCDTQVQSIPHQPTTDACSLDCPSGYECKSVQGMSACQPVSTTPSSLSETSTNKQTGLCGSSDQMRNLTERMCPGGLMCMWGACVADGTGMHCDCDNGAHGLICENQCCRDCGENGTCYYDVRNQIELCNCYNGYTGETCEFVKTTPAAVVQHDEDKFMLIVGVCVGIVMFLIIIFAVLLYVMWRHRVILVMKIVHYFQGYEDDDDREWDAFISYKSDPKDEEFVVKVLFPTLEKEMGFKTHVHFRDFIPGDTIANNIIRAVQSSRRTILIISPNFVKSEFTRFEYQVAQQEMLKHKHRIIPILLDDITEHKDTIDPNLKVILGSVTYLEWPQEQTEKKLSKFWKRLQLSLPKKRSLIEKDGEERKISTKENKLYIEIDTPTIKNNNVIIKVPEYIEKEDASYTTIDDTETVYDKIDDLKIKETRENDIKRQVNEYVDILECTRM